MKSVKSSFFEIHESEEYQYESAKIAFAMEIKRAMDAKGVNNTQLASCLGVSKPMVTKLLRGDANVTIETMVRACMALDGKLVLRIEREERAVKGMIRATEAAIAASVKPGRPWRPALAAGNLDSWSIRPCLLQDNNEAQPVAA